MTEHLDPQFEAYLLANRAFMAPAVGRAVESLRLDGATRILDVGTGAGGALPALARAAGPGALVLGVDRAPGVVALAAAHATDTGVRGQVNLLAADLVEVAQQATANGETFDAIWASDVVWPGNFTDPATVVRHLGAALAPGGIIALFSSNYYQAMFLPGHGRLERQLRTASELRWGLPADGPAHYERHLRWLLDAGLQDVALQVIPRIGFPIDDDPAVRAYLETAVLPELRESATTHGREAGMSAADLTRAADLLDPGSKAYVLDEPGYYVMHSAILATGCRP